MKKKEILKNLLYFFNTENSWHACHNLDIISLNLAKLAKQGIILENHYVQPICTPTRSALMTGYYPIHTGRQVQFAQFKVP